MIQLADVCKSFDEVEVLRGVTFTVRKGEVVCLIGPSGCGKSTVLRCINGLENHDSGTVSVAGIPVNRQSAGQVRKQLAMVFQRFNLFPHRTALENITEGPIFVRGVPPAEAREEAMALLESVGLAGKANAYPSQLSGGQQQRVGIARALAMRPAAILLDEPTSALDPELVSDVLNLLQGLAEKGMTMIIATHEIAFARHAADRVVFMHEGAVLESGAPREVLVHPQRAQTRAFLQRILRHHD